MCGIAGIINLNKEEIDLNSLFNITDQLNTRGPDGEGYMITRNSYFFNQLKEKRPQIKLHNVENKQLIGFGHRRLATTDLGDNASQPMTDANRRYWIVFNGQIYNHVNLRLELENFGYKFLTSHSDTEVILNAYDKWGIDFLSRLKGTWAFCLWDSKENNIIISRDRVGKQPLYYTVINKTLFFASEIKALLKIPNFNKEIEDTAVYDYLTYTNVPAPRTIFKNIFKLPASHFISFKPGEDFVIKRFWDPIKLNETLNLNENEIIEKIKEKVINSVKLRINSDVQIGSLLSGGLDSSIILACMANLSDKPVKSYCVGFENTENYKNEFKYAKQVAQLYNADYNELIVTKKDFFEGINIVTQLQDEPIADTANIPLYYISKKAHNDGVKILLSGEGSDEVFIGYQHWRLISNYEKVFRKRPRMAITFDFIHSNSIFKNKRPFYHMWAYKTKNNWPVFWSGTEVSTEHEKRNILTKEFVSRIGDYNSFIPKSSLYNELISSRDYDTFQWMTINDLLNRLPDQLLARLDRMTMASSIEGRNPFLDVDLVEFMLKVPSHFKTKNKIEKYLLKKAFEDILPDDIIHRSKDSFSVPLNHLFSDSKTKKEYIGIISDFNRQTRIFKNEYIDNLILPVNIKEFWNTLNFTFWYNNHFVNKQ